jgi:hypothetical protein
MYLIAFAVVVIMLLAAWWTFAPATPISTGISTDASVGIYAGTSTAAPVTSPVTASVTVPAGSANPLVDVVAVPQPVVQAPLATYCVSGHSVDGRARVTLGDTCADTPWVQSFTFKARPGKAPDSYCVLKANSGDEIYRLQSGASCTMRGYSPHLEFSMSPLRTRKFCRSSRPNPTRHRLALRGECQRDGYGATELIW